MNKTSWPKCWSIPVWHVLKIKDKEQQKKEQVASIDIMWRMKMFFFFLIGQRTVFKPADVVYSQQDAA